MVTEGTPQAAADAAAPPPSALTPDPAAAAVTIGAGMPDSEPELGTEPVSALVDGPKQLAAAFPGHELSRSSRAVHADDYINTHRAVAPPMHVSTTFRYNRELGRRPNERIGMEGIGSWVARLKVGIRTWTLT